MGVFPTSLGRNRSNGTFEDLEQCLLDTLTRDVARDRWVLGFASNLVDLIDVDDACLGSFRVEVRSRDDLEKNVLHILPHITGLCECCGICNGKRHVQHAGKRLGHQGLA